MKIYAKPAIIRSCSLATPGDPEDTTRWIVLWEINLSPSCTDDGQIKFLFDHLMRRTSKYGSKEVNI